MRKRPCWSCATLTRRTMRVPVVGEDHRVYVCSRCPMPDLSAHRTPEARLLVAVYGGLSKFYGRPVSWYGHTL